MIALKVLATFCLATFCLASPATLTENEKQIEILMDTIGKLGAKLVKKGWTPQGEEELIEEPIATKGKASRLSDEEFVVGKEGEIYQQGSLLWDFFQRMFGGRKERHEDDQFASIEPLKIITKSNLMANVDVSLTGARLVGLVETDFKSVIDKLSVGKPQHFNIDLIVKIDDFTVKVRKTGDFTSLIRALRKFSPQYSPPRHFTAQEKFFELLDAFDGPFHIIGDSIIGDVKATYKKINPFIKWMYENQKQTKLGKDYLWSTYGGEKIKVGAKLKLSVGDDNFADIEFNGEATEAVKTFTNNGYLEALNGKIVICADKICKQDKFKNFLKKAFEQNVA